MRSEDDLGWKFAIPVYIRLSILWFVVVLLAACALVGLYHYSAAKYRSTIIFGTSVLGGVLTIWGLLQSAENLRRANYERKLEASARYVERWNNPSYLELKTKWRELNSSVENFTPEEIAAMLERDLEKRITVVEILNFFEEMAVAILTEMADEKLLKRTFCIAIRKAYQRYGHWIDVHRTNRNARAYWSETQTLYERWGK